ncbi:MAG: anthranilate synthase component I family protein [Verrucomicrobiota bacterium]
MNVKDSVGLFPAPATRVQEQCFYVFKNPVEWISGSLEEMHCINKVIENYREVLPDGQDPHGAVFGRVDYEGHFEFAVCSEIEVISADKLLPEEVVIEQSSSELWQQSMTEKDYCNKVELAQKHIADGNIYQVNLARHYHIMEPHLDEWELFKHLWALTEAPRSSLFIGQKRSVISASPECFLQMHGKQIMTQPIKGTRPRDRDETRDKQNAFDLMHNEKEIAELVMITDLERNDLGKVCEYGSIRVRDLVAREAFSHVFHLYSTIEGTIRPELSHVDVLQSCFPGGSITGAPKKRAMEIIRELETSSRGTYTGCLGYFGFNGDSHFNIAIRSFEYQNAQLSFGVGSGITSDSIGDKEYEETEHKAQALLEAYESYRLSHQYDYLEALK